MMNHLVKGTADPFSRRHVWITDSDNGMKGHDVRDVEEPFETLLNMDGDPLTSQSQSCCSQMNERTGVGEAIRQMGLMPAECVASHDR